MASSAGPDIVTNCRIPPPGQLADPFPSGLFLSGSLYHIRPWDEVTAAQRHQLVPPLIRIIRRFAASPTPPFSAHTMTRNRPRRPASGQSRASEAPYEADAPAPKTREAITVGYGRSPDPPPPCAICDSAPSDPTLSVMPLALSLDPAHVTPSALLAVIRHYHTVLEAFDELRRAYTLARQHNEQLHAAPAAMREIADRFVSFVQRKYNASQAKLEDANFRAADAMASMDRMKDQLRQFEVLKIEHELLRETSTETYDRLQDYAARLERRIEGRVIDGELDGSVLQIAQDLGEVRRENADIARHAADHHNQIRSAQAAQASTSADLDQSRRQCDQLQTRLKDLLAHAQRVEASNQQLREDLRAMSGGDSIVHSLRLELHVRGERIRELNGLLDRVAAHRDRLQQDLQAAQRRADLATAAVERTNEATARQHDQVHDAQRRARDLEEQLDRSRQARAQHARDYQALSSDYRRSQERLAQAYARVAALGTLQSENNTLREDLRVVATARDALQADKEMLLSDKEALQVELMATQESLNQAQAQAAPTVVVPPADPPTPATTHTGVVQVICGDCREVLAQIADIQGAYSHVRRDFDDLEAEFRSLETEHDGLETVYNTLVEDHSLTLGRIQEIASLAVIAPSRVAGVSPLPACPPSAGSPSSSKRARAPRVNTDPQEGPASKRVRRGSSSAVASPGGSSGAQPSALAPPAVNTPLNIDSVVDLVGDELDDDYACSDTSTEFVGSDSESSDDEDLRVARARSRSDLRRRSPEPGSRPLSVQDGSAAAPIKVGDADGQESSDPVEAPAVAPARGDRAVAGDAGTGAFVPFGPTESFVPGLRQQRVVSAADVAPWEPSQISILTMDTVTPRVIIEYQVLTAGWMFPERVGRGGTLDRQLYAPELITRANVEALYAEEPWQVLATRPAPHTFDLDLSPQLMSIVDGYLEFENDCLQAIWESTHSFPITQELQRSDAWWSSFYTRRKNRSSHAREKYRNWQEQGFAKARRTGCCDLDLWLDRMFTRFPQQNEDTTWFPGREAVAVGRPAPTNLLDALADCDRADPWRNHFRTAPGTHPALAIPRLLLKFSRTS